MNKDEHDETWLVPAGQSATSGGRILGISTFVMSEAIFVKGKINLFVGLKEQ